MVGVLLIIGLAIGLGALGLPLVFTELAPDETTGERALVTASFYFFASVLIGYLRPRLWPLGILTAWGGLIIGFPIAIATAGSYVGSILKTKGVIARLLGRTTNEP